MPLPPNNDLPMSRSEQKRRSKNVEHLAAELAELGNTELKKAPCSPELRQEIAAARDMKAGARKRQIKYVGKLLREIDPGPLLAFLEERKGSRLRQATRFHELERLRDDILGEAIRHREDTFHPDDAPPSPFDWQSATIEAAARLFPRLDQLQTRTAALAFAATHRPLHRREVFRLLKAAEEQENFRAAAAEPHPDEE